MVLLELSTDLINQDTQEQVSIAETATPRVRNYIRYVVAGSSPPADYPKPIHIMLKEAIAQTWPDVTTDPLVQYIGFSNTWFTDSRDIEIVFLHSVDDRDVRRRSTDWRFIPMTTFVDIHLFVRANSVDVEPEYLYKTRAALENVVETNKTRLIPHASVVLEGSNYVPERDNQQNVWHWLYSCAVRYAKTMAVV